MINNKAKSGTIALIIILILVVAVVVYFSIGRTSSSQSNSGRVVFAVTDASANMGTVSNVYVTVDSVKIHSATNNDAWTDIPTNNQRIDLLQLKNSGQFELLAQQNITPGSYDQAVLEISDVTVVDANGSHEAKLPSNTLKFNADMNVSSNSTTTTSLDFLVDNSLHLTGNDRYILAPVVRVQTRSNSEVNEKDNAMLEINGGEAHTDEQIGMDEKGNVGVGVSIPANADLMLDSSRVISIQGSGGSMQSSDNTSVQTGLGIQGSNNSGLRGGIGY